MPDCGSAWRPCCSDAAAPPVLFPAPWRDRLEQGAAAAGLTDIPLNARGEEQAALARAIASRLGLKSIAVSSLARARHTAEIINHDLGLRMTHYDALREFDAAIEDPESFSDFRNRVLGGMIEALTLDHPVLVVAHGGVFWALQRLLGFAELMHIPNCAVARFEPPAAGDVWRITLLQGDCAAPAAITA
jgi:broad specificity phosphatase PhoE